SEGHRSPEPSSKCPMVSPARFDALPALGIPTQHFSSASRSCAFGADSCYFRETLGGRRGPRNPEIRSTDAFISRFSCRHCDGNRRGCAVRRRARARRTRCCGALCRAEPQDRTQHEHQLVWLCRERLWSLLERFLELAAARGRLLKNSYRLVGL